MAGRTIDGPLQAFLQQVASAVATVLRLEVTIVDGQLRRVAGSGGYAGGVGQSVPASSSFAEVIRTRRPRVILEPRTDPACRHCEVRDECGESCHVSYPLLLDGEPLGVLGLIGFTPEQRDRVERHGEEYLAFIEGMAQLIESTVHNLRATQELAEVRDQLRGVVEAVGEGILAVDAQGTVICCNPAARRMLGLEDAGAVGKPLAGLFPDAPMLAVLRTGAGYADREVGLSSPAGPLRHVSTVTPLFSEGRVVGAVALMKRLEDVHRIAYEISAGQPDRAIAHILGDDPALEAARQMALRAAAGHATVLLRGESGTGKELFARAVHYHSPRRSRPFVAVNCAAVPEDLLESELFGYEEGAFTGARRGGKPGRFELAGGGTLFLDEVADCSLRLQAKLLRALDLGEVQRIGGTRTVTVNVRVVAATNKDLEARVRHGEFREDLYFRLNVIPIPIPPLRERRDDILPLFRHFLRQPDRPALALTAAAEAILQAYDWPGNVRELQNAAQYVLHTCSGGVVDPSSLPPRVAQAGGEIRPLELMPSAEWERRAIAEGLRRLGDTPGAKAALARQLGLSRSTIYRKIKRYGLLNTR